jgi:hypothetical protein
MNSCNPIDFLLILMYPITRLAVVYLYLWRDYEDLPCGRGS